MDVRNELLSQPVVDGSFTSDPFLPKDPKIMIREGQYNHDVDILLGFNEEEGHMVTSVFEAFPLLYSAMAAGWPILGTARSVTSRNDMSCHQDPSPCSTSTTQRYPRWTTP